MCDDLTIPQWFSGKNIFITGASGFLGKTLIEKLLRSCPKIEKIYILIRPKKGKCVKQRVQEMVNIPLFDTLKSKSSSFLNKIVPIEGDITEPNLGINEKSRKLLMEKINIVFHSAASVRFDDPLKKAILINTRAPRDLANLALEMKNIKVFVHISTSYCNVNRSVIDEEIYPPHTDWQEAIQIAEELDGRDLDVLTAKFIDPLPNTYTFTKQLGEHAINDICGGRIPTVIFRPTIVVSTLCDPIPGWIDNFNGPVALQIAIAKGIMKVSYTNSEITPDYIPVDIITKALIVAAWKKGLDCETPKSVDIYNASNNKVNSLTNQQIADLGMVLCQEVPFNNILRYPSITMTSNMFNYYIQVLFRHVLPALFLDGILKLFNQKPRLMKLQRTVYNANMALSYFLFNEWQFLHRNFLQLDQSVLDADKEEFEFSKTAITMDLAVYFKACILGARRYLLNEDDDSLPKARTHSKRMWYLSRGLNFLLSAAASWFVFSICIRFILDFFYMLIFDY